MIIKSTLLLPVALLLTGCAGLTTATTAPTSPVSLAGAPAQTQGRTMGGQQPVVGSTIQLYAAGTAGYNSASTPLLTSTVLTDSGGNFNITGKYTCSAGQLVYLTASGGNAGTGNNPNLVLAAALGDCSTLTSSTFININELTTIAAAYALEPFLNDAAHLGTSSTNVAGLRSAFVNAAKLVNTSTGNPGGPALAAGAVLPVAELNTLANILAACVNSTGGASGDNTPCGQLFGNTGGSGVTDTLVAAIYIPYQPTTNVTALYNLSSPNAPFQPQLAAAPKDWSISINYTLGGFNAPSGIVIDANNRIIVPNAGNNTVTVLNQSGSPASLLLLNGLNAPSAAAIDVSGNIWVTNKVGNSVSAFTPAGVPLAGSPFLAAGNLSGPVALAFDAPGNVFVANNTGNSVTELTSSGAYVQQITTNVLAPTAVAINPR